MVLGDVGGAVVGVDNPSFEDDALGPGSFIFSATNWQQGGGTSSGTVRAGGPPFPPTPDGVNIGFVNGGAGAGGFNGLYQVLAAVIEEDTRYVLRVEVGDRSDLPFPDTIVALGAGSVWGDQVLPADALSVPSPDSSFST